MSARNWLERFLDTLADHGLPLTGLKERDSRRPSDSELCHRLIEGTGEASNIALAREVFQRWQQMDDTQRIVFLNMVAVEFDPDPGAIRQAAENYRERDPGSLHRLLAACEPPRQELFRRLNMAPDGTASLVSLRAYVLSVLRDNPQLKSVDEDLHHLFVSWFNRGFLRIERIDWNTPAAILEKLIRYEAVHPMSGWDDLRRRLAADRRCFAFFHPALPGDPLIFIEVALTTQVSASIAPLIDPQAPVSVDENADTAVFYSINNALDGLRGISFGNFLIKQVVNELQDELPAINTFVTLSPIPRLREVMAAQLSAEQPANPEFKSYLLSEYAQLFEQAPAEDMLVSMMIALGSDDESLRQSAEAMLHDVVLIYITQNKRGDYAFDPVAHFHLSNGARLQRINIRANNSERCMRDSCSCMVNYLYELDSVVANHESYLAKGEIALSEKLHKAHHSLFKRIAAHRASAEPA